uniref:EMAP like 2 n=1 Tax=Callorhinchus milii TaxID=7868 RepID=A0A4W3H1Z5_CALMI
ALSHSSPPPLTLPHSLTLPRSLSYNPSLSHTPSLPLTQSHSLSYDLSLSLSLSLSRCQCSNEPVLAASFHPTEANLIVTCGKSHILFWTLEGSVLTKKQGIFEKQEKPKYVLSVTFSQNGDVISGDSSGNLIIWGKGTNRIRSVVAGAHEGGIFSVCMRNDGTLLSGGGKDRKLILWDQQYRKLQESEVPEAFGPVRTIAEGKGAELFVGTTRNCILQGSLANGYNPIVQGHTDELWGLAAHPSTGLFATCGHDRLLHLWDSSSHQPVWSQTLDDPAQAVGFHPSGSVIAVGLQTARLNPPVTLPRPPPLPDANAQLGSKPLTVRPSARGRPPDAACVSCCCCCCCFLSQGHSSFVTHLDWSHDSHYFVTNSGDYEILHWTPSCKQVTSADQVRSVQWVSSTCALGFQVFGVWPEGADGTDINAICRSADDQLLATADDFGKVNLFSFPCSHPRVRCRGQSSRLASQRPPPGQ